MTENLIFFFYLKLINRDLLGWTESRLPKFSTFHMQMWNGHISIHVANWKSCDRFVKLWKTKTANNLNDLFFSAYQIQDTQSPPPTGWTTATGLKIPSVTWFRAHQVPSVQQPLQRGGFTALSRSSLKDELRLTLCGPTAAAAAAFNSRSESDATLLTDKETQVRFVCK